MGIEVKVSAEERRIAEHARENATRTTAPRVYGISAEQRKLQLYLKQAFNDYYAKMDTSSRKKIEPLLRGFRENLKEDLSAKAPHVVATVYAVDRNKIPMSMALQDVVANWNLKAEAFGNHLAPDANRLELHKETVQKDYGHVWN